MSYAREFSKSVVMLDVKKRGELFKKAYGKIADDVPYVFLFNPKYEFYSQSKKVSKPGDTLTYSVGHLSWWSAQK